jgi:P27 family predicted phage terminase small subunit
MGRPRIPTEIKKAMGNPGKRKIARQEPDPEYLDDLTAPAWLPDGAKVVWNEYAQKMRNAKVLTVIDVEAFALWCYKVAKHRAAIADLERLGIMVDRAPKDGELAVEKSEKARGAPAQVVNQLFFAESMLFKQVLALEREFGMTPAARTRVQVDPQLTLFPNDDGERAEHGQQPKQPSKGSPYFTGGAAPH